MTVVADVLRYSCGRGMGLEPGGERGAPPPSGFGSEKNVVMRPGAEATRAMGEGWAKLVQQAARVA